MTDTELVTEDRRNRLERAEDTVSFYALAYGFRLKEMFAEDYGWTAEETATLTGIVSDLMADLAVFCESHDLDFNRRIAFARKERALLSAGR